MVRRRCLHSQRHISRFFFIFSEPRHSQVPLYATWHLPPRQLADNRGVVTRFCVVSCVVTQASLPVSRKFAHCRSGTGEAQGTANKPA